MAALFKVPAIIIYVLGGLWGLIICLGIIHSKLGFIATLVAFFVLPATVYLAPLYAGFADGNWWLFVVSSGT